MKPAFKALLLLLGTLLPPLIAQAQTQSQGGIPPYVEYRKRVETSQNISPLDVGLFGEQVSLYNGSTVFSVTDIDIPGNNGALPLKLTRKLAVELQPQGGLAYYDSRLLGAGNWDMDVPYLTGTYPSSSGLPSCSQGVQPSNYSIAFAGSIAFRVDCPLCAAVTLGRLCGWNNSSHTHWV